jgi:hypothetical protein
MDTTVKKEAAPGSAQPLLMVKHLIKHFALKKDVFVSQRVSSASANGVSG